MQLSPSKDLSRHFKHIPILASGGVSVKGLIPELAVCPFCHRQQFAIYMDPLVNDSKWMHCTSCNFSGDCVELYGRMKGSPDLVMAVRQAISDGFGAVPDMKLLGEDIETYVNSFPARRKEHKARWEQLRSGLVENVSPEVVRRLQSEYLWGGWRNGYQDRMLRFMGAGLRQEVINLMDLEQRTLPKDLFRTVLALNFQDTPGRICAFMFIGESGFRVVKELTENMRDGGLAMLDALLPQEKTVFAVDDPYFALHVQRRHLIDHDAPLKFIVYNHATSASWSSVSADKVVLWSRTKDWNVFRHARRVRNGHVAIIPRLGDSNNDIYDYLKASPLTATLRRLEADAKPWFEALCVWLTDKDLSEAAARDAVAKLTLTPGEKQLIAENCPKSLYDRVMGLMGDSRIYTTNTVNGFPITEREDGYYVYRPRSGEERITDALVKLESEICDKVTGKSVWKGNIRFKGVDVPYQVPADTIERNYKVWLDNCTIKAGLGTATLNRNWVHHMPNLIRLFSAPRTIQTLSHIGVQTNGDIIFPQFKIVGGQIRDVATFFGEDAPASKIMPPLTRTGHPTDTCNPARSCWLALACAYMSNLMSEERQIPVTPVLLAGPHGSVVRTVGKQFAKAADMPVWTIGGTHNKCEQVRAKFNVYGYPSYAESNVHGQLKDYPLVNTDNVFLVCDALEAAGFAIGGRWLTVYAPKMYSENCLPPIHDLFLYLADLQKREYELNTQLPLHEALLEDMCRWYSTYLGADQADTLAEARNYMHGPVPAGDALLHLCFWLYSRGELDLVKKPFMAQLTDLGNIYTKHSIAVDDDAGKVFIFKPHVFKCIKAHQLPSPDLTLALDDLNNRGVLVTTNRDVAGWVFEQAYWNEQAKVWKDHTKQIQS